MEEESRIILLKDIVELRLQKQKELAYYQEQLEKLQLRMSLIQHEISVTTTIIDMIEQEKVLNILENME